MQPTDPNDDARLDELLSRARWPEPSADSTRRLQATWAGVSPAGRGWRRWGVALTAAAAVVVMGIGLTAALLVSRNPAETAATAATATDRRATVVIPPQVLPSPVAATRQTLGRDFGRLVALVDKDMTSSDKLVIWSEIRRPARAARSQRAPAAPHPAPRQASPAVNVIPAAPLNSNDVNVTAMRVQLARG